MTPAQEFAAKRTEAEALVRQHAPARLQDALIDLLRPAIALHATRAEDAQIPLGASKFGGAPDVPKDFEWPLWNDKPLGFLAQINLEEVAPFDSEKQLPRSGKLLFFLSLDEKNPVGGEPKQRQGWQVRWVRGRLHRVEVPADSHWIAPILTQRVYFEPHWGFADDSYNEMDWGEDEWSDFQWEVLERPPYRMLACAYAPQLSPLVIAANGSQRREGYALYDERVSTQDWQLLLQLDTMKRRKSAFFKGNDSLHWLYFMIHADDLKRGDFSKVWFNEQCT